MEQDFVKNQNPSCKGKWLLVGLLAALLAVCVLLVLRIRSTAPQAETPLPAFSEDRAMDVWFLDVGQGDSILIRSPRGKTMLVDGGIAESADTILNQLDALGIDTIDLLICTHCHDDHIGGIPAVINHYKIKKACFPLHYREEDYSQVISALEKQRISPKALTASMTADLQLDSAVSVQVLSPMDVEYDSENERSLVLRIIYENTSILLTGDAGALAEKLMLKAFPDRMLASTVLKLGHHGSFSSTTRSFLSAVKPGIAVASCGKNNAYGHPDPSVQALLKEFQIPLFTTADYGTIHLMLDGHTVRVVK